MPTAHHPHFSHPVSIRAAAAGGCLPRHYRVQTYDHRTLTWRLQASFAHRELAEMALTDLESSGYACRLVEIAHCATAV